MKVLVPYSDELVQEIQETLGSEAIVVQSSRSLESMLEHGGDADIVVSGRVPAEYIRKNKSLKMIQTLGAGVNSINREAVLERDDITVCNSHANAAEVAEYTIALLLAIAKNLMMNDRELRKGDWTLRWGGPIYNAELMGKTCLIVGLGHVGSEIARRLRSFDMTINAVTRTGKSPHDALVDELVCFEDLKTAVEHADFVILSLPLTEQSRGLVDTEFLSWMHPSSILVNISRGAIVEEAALYMALKDKKIRGAALDVWWRYPSPDEQRDFSISEEFAFHELDNLVISPHRAAYAEYVEREMVRDAGANILRFIRGEPVRNIVDMHSGY